MSYVCSNCGAPAYNDGRCGDGPVLICNCVKKGKFINDGRGGYYIYPNNPQPIDEEYNNEHEEWPH